MFSEQDKKEFLATVGEVAGKIAKVAPHTMFKDELRLPVDSETTETTQGSDL